MDIHRCRFVDYSPHTITSSAFSHPSSGSPVVQRDLRLALGRSNGDIEIWNPRNNWSHEITIPGAKGCSVDGLCWSSTEDFETLRLFSIGGSTFVTEWDLNTGTPLVKYDCNSGTIWSMDVSQDGKSLAVGCDDGSVVIIDISGGPGFIVYKQICQRQDSRVLCMKWIDNEKLVGGCADARIRCWSSAGDSRGRIVGVMKVDKSKTESTLVWTVCILPKSNVLVSGDSTGSIKFWDLKHFTLLQTFKVHDADVLCLAKSFKEDKIFSAGVDRKIHEFDMVQNKNKVSKWIHSSNRFLHSNDVRTLSTYENKNYSFLISGGVESSLLIQNVHQFQEGKYRRISMSQQMSNIVVSPEKHLIIMWQNQTVKIWKTFNSDDTNKQKLVAKLVLADDENITQVSINSDASIIAIVRQNSIKFFRLFELEGSEKFKVEKIRCEDFSRKIDGAKKCLFYNTKQGLILTIGGDLLKFEMDTSQDNISILGAIESCDQSSPSKSNLPYKNSIKNIIISEKSSIVVITRFNGVIEILPLVHNSFKPFQLLRMSSLPHLICFSETEESIIVLSDENKVYEFSCELNGDKLADGLLSSWSKRNTEFMPKQFLRLEDKPEGMFVEKKYNRVWIYGSSWLCFFDLTQNIPLSSTYKAGGNVNKKRNNDGLTISRSSVGEDSSEEADLDGSETQANALDSALKQTQLARLKEKFNDEDADEIARDSSKPFWLTTKYRQILFSNSYGNGIVVVEKPAFTSSPPAFSLPKIRI